MLFDGNATLTNVTISGNSSDSGGGIYQNGGTYTITNVTVFGNSGLTGAGGLHKSSGVMTVNNTIVANNICGDCYLSIASNSFSLSSDNACGFPLGRYDVDVALGPLAPNGGFTQTHLPLPGSPVIDNGTGIGCPGTDQRGVARPQGAACDVGAVEYRTEETVACVYLPMITR